MKCCAIDLAISRVMENVVVVVVVTTRLGFRGSGPRLDWENLREAKFWAASSLRNKVCENGGRGGSNGYDMILERTHVVKLLGKVRKNCLWVVSSRDTMRVAKRSRVS
jgi:hypothetical protein